MKGINAYQTFGLSTEWLGDYLREPRKWWTSNSLGTRQFDAVQVWLGQAGVINRKSKTITDLGNKLRKYGEQDPLTWMAIWSNLSVRSVLVRWFVRNLPFGRSYTRDELLDRLGDTSSRRTRSNAIASLVNLLEKTPLGKQMGLGLVVRKGRVFKAIVKQGVSDLPSMGILHSLYRLAEERERYSFSVSELCTTGTGELTDLFGIQQTTLERCLRGLATRYRPFVRVEILRGLDNVYLEPTRTSEEVLDLERD